MRMKLAWLSNTRHDLLFEISQLAQVRLSVSWTELERIGSDSI